MCKNWGGGVREYVISLENFRFYMYSLTELYVAGDYIPKFQWLRELPGNTHTCFTIVQQPKCPEGLSGRI